MSVFQGVLLPITPGSDTKKIPVGYLLKFLSLPKLFPNFCTLRTITDTITDSAVTPQPHAPCTHTSLGIIQLLKSLSLSNILQRNKKIEADNDARSAKTLNNALDPAGHPQPGSEVASLITVDPKDLA